jgi:cbb3-type cytochrome oxidase maturation protein
VILTICLIAGGVVLAAAAAIAFAASVKGGQLDDLEETKYQMLREDDHR